VPRNSIPEALPQLLQLLAFAPDGNTLAVGIYGAAKSRRCDLAKDIVAQIVSPARAGYFNNALQDDLLALNPSEQLLHFHIQQQDYAGARALIRDCPRLLRFVSAADAAKSAGRTALHFLAHNKPGKGIGSYPEDFHVFLLVHHSILNVEY
jgi:hypothetical protein